MSRPWLASPSSASPASPASPAAPAAPAAAVLALTVASVGPRRWLQSPANGSWILMERPAWSDNWKLPQNHLDPGFHAESPSIWVSTVSTPTKVWSDDIVARCKTLLTHCFFSSSKLASLCLMVRLTIFFSSICLFSPSEDVRNKIEKNCHFHHTHRFHSLSFSCLSGQRVCSYLAFLCSWQRSLVRQSLILIHYRYDSFARDIMYSHGLFDLVLWHPQVYQVLQFVPQLSCGQKIF